MKEKKGDLSPASHLPSHLSSPTAGSETRVAAIISNLAVPLLRKSNVNKDGSARSGGRGASVHFRDSVHSLAVMSPLTLISSVFR